MTNNITVAFDAKEASVTVTADGKEIMALDFWAICCGKSELNKTLCISC